MLQLSCAPTLAQKLVLTPFTSIFQKTEELLNQKSYYIKAIKRVGRFKNIAKYNDIIDFLFCETFPGWRYYCFKFYKDKGPSLKEYKSMTPELIEYYDSFMVDNVLPSILSSKRFACWEDFRTELHLGLFEQLTGEVTLLRYGQSV